MAQEENGQAQIQEAVEENPVAEDAQEVAPAAAKGGRCIIREARPQDLPAIEALLASEGLYSSGLRPHRFLVAEVGGEIVGCGQIRRYPGLRELGSLAVRRKWRGQGIGSALVERLLEHGGGELYLLCAPHLEGFYRRFGFRPLGFGEMPLMLKIKYILCRLGWIGGIGGRIVAMKRFERKGAARR